MKERMGLPDFTPEQMLLALAKAGLTYNEMAAILGFSVSTLKTILENDQRLWEQVEEAQAAPNFKVEQALFKRALGYQVKEITKEDGRPIKVVLKDNAPDVVACIFWLKNRDPRRWRDVVEMKFSLRDRMERASDALNRPPERKALVERTEEEE